MFIGRDAGEIGREPVCDFGLAEDGVMPRISNVHRQPDKALLVHGFAARGGASKDREGGNSEKER
ncbi:hypothetical protein Sa4125_23830 [Aureimonas sp. SA4125]|nr:hypothetical protein Sa4125_23830 [Aureimonas sp. SA4125]